MNERRYEVGCTSGYGGTGGRASQWAADAFVMDTAYCHQVVGEKFTVASRNGKTRERAIVEAKALAQAEADLLERGPGTLAEHIYCARVSRKLSRQELADQLGVHVNSVWRWEIRERTPSPGSWLHIAEALDLPLELAP